jgi:hypothetical protein
MDKAIKNYLLLGALAMILLTASFELLSMANGNPFGTIIVGFIRALTISNLMRAVGIIFGIAGCFAIFIMVTGMSR